MMQPTNQPAVGGGIIKAKVLDEIQEMSGHILLIVLVLVCVYVSRLPESILNRFKTTLYKVGGLVLIVLITVTYGWVHGILATLAFALIISHVSRQQSEGFAEYIPGLTSERTVVPTSQRWLNERILGENPYIISETSVNTSAVQDFSEKNMGSSRSSR
jgi:hypothetical protein